MFANNRPLARRGRQLWQLALWLVPVALGGCYDGDALMKEAHSAVLTAALAEVDLGEYVTTLPRDPESGDFTMINLHLFGTVTRADLSAVEKQLKGDNYKLRHETLAALRRSSRDELADPTLSGFRARILNVVNRVFADAPVKDVGFYQLTVR